MKTDLSTTYLGLKLANPIVVSACPLTGELDVLRTLEDFGAAAAVLPSLFEEQLEGRPAEGAAVPRAPGAASLIESAAFFHELKEYNRGADEYLKHITAARAAVSIPLIGSLNVVALGEWVRYAGRIEEAGADALELNVNLQATAFDTTSQELEARYVDVVAAVRNEVSIPLAVKIGPQFTALPHFAGQLVEAGANGLVLFNRFLQPEIDLDKMSVVPRLALSTPEEMRESLRAVGLLHGRLRASLAATTGVHFADDVIRLVLAGADVVMVASTLYRHGVEILPMLVDGVRYWLEMREYASIGQIRGMLSQKSCPDPGAFARANYARAISSYAAGGAW
jgi:dihydroorotate dehydrogenase (fumarate)